MQRLSLRSNEADLSTYWLGRCSYQEARRLAREVYHPELLSGGLTLLLAEHDPCLTLGKRVNTKDLDHDLLDYWNSKGISIINTDRGGLMTYHGPGQLMIYPLVSLRYYKVSVRLFVQHVLNCVAEVLHLFDVKACADSALQGVWVKVGEVPRKIASAGFRIVNGLSEHGVCLYVDEVSPEFSRFLPCGNSPDSLISLSDYLGSNFGKYSGIRLKLEDVRKVFEEKFAERLLEKMQKC